MITLPIDYDLTHWSIRKQVREEYTLQQDGKCYHCKNPLTGKPTEEVLDKFVNKKLFPNGFFKSPIHLHHSHETGMTIGSVHSYCNAVLWQYHNE